MLNTKESATRCPGTANENGGIDEEARTRPQTPESLRAFVKADPKRKASFLVGKTTKTVCDALADLGLLRRSLAFLKKGNTVSAVRTYRLTAAAMKVVDWRAA